MNEKKPNKRQRQYAETLDAIRAAVDKLVNDVGFEDMRIQDICREVGISPGAFYHYFPSKNDVFVDRFRRRNAYYRKLHDETLVDMEPIQALKKFMSELITFTHTRVLGVVRPYSKALIDEYPRWQEDDGDAVLEVCALLVRRGQEEGVLSRRFSAEEVAMALNDYYRGLMISRSVQPSTEEECAARQAIMFAFLDSLGG